MLSCWKRLLDFGPNWMTVTYWAQTQVNWKKRRSFFMFSPHSGVWSISLKCFLCAVKCRNNRNESARCARRVTEPCHWNQMKKISSVLVCLYTPESIRTWNWNGGHVVTWLWCVSVGNGVFSTSRKGAALNLAALCSSPERQSRATSLLSCRPNSGLLRQSGVEAARRAGGEGEGGVGVALWWRLNRFVAQD